MRKVSNILFLIGGIYAIVSAVTLFVFAIIFLTGASPLLEVALKPILEQNGVTDPDKVVLLIRIYSIVCGVVFLIVAALCIPSAIVSFLVRKNPSKGLLIANIVIGYLCGTTYNVVGGILGLIYNYRLAKKEAQQPKVIDAQ